MGKGQGNPFRGFVDVMNEMSRARTVGMTGHETGYEDRERTHATAWVPSADIFASGRDLVVRIGLSGVHREDIDLSFSNGVLTVTGERRSEPDEEEMSYYIRERYYGKFRRTFSSLVSVDESDISADFENGMLKITIRGGAVAEPQSIEIGSRSGS